MTPAALSLAFLVLIILAFFAAFELGRPQAGDIVLVAQLCALCTVARLIFSFVPYFNPVVGVIFLSGIALGCRKGFVVGAMTALVSNIFLGQGPWTLFQMVSWGLAGFSGGVLSGCGLVKKTEWAWMDFVAAVFSAAVIVIFVTGPLMDLSSYFLYGYSLKLALAGGFVFNVTLAASTAATILVFAVPFLRAVNRARP